MPFSVVACPAMQLQSPACLCELQVGAQPSLSHLRLHVPVWLMSLEC